MSSSARYVFDANVIVSAVLLPRSVPRQAFDFANSKGELLLSQPMLAELDDVLRRPKLNKYISERDRVDFLVALLHAGEIVDIQTTITDCPDPKDNKYLELAVDGDATCIVSGDSHLLSMHPYRGISIIKPRDLLTGAH
jgi:putative PIN family toxin of toxin-antitoxin system